MKWQLIHESHTVSCTRRTLAAEVSDQGCLILVETSYQEGSRLENLVFVPNVSCEDLKQK